MAYTSSEADELEVYAAFYSEPVRKWQVSGSGESRPVRNPKGGELFYLYGQLRTASEVTSRRALEYIRQCFIRSS